jgi:hypothetical protein
MSRPVRVTMLHRALVVSFMAASGCVPERGPIPQEYRAILAMPTGHPRTEAFRRFPVKDQVNIYLLGMKTEHPPPMGFAWEVARNGKTALPYLAQALREAESTAPVDDVMTVLELIACEEGISLTGAPIIADAQSAIRRARVTAGKEAAEARLQRILGECEKSR